MLAAPKTEHRSQIWNMFWWWNHQLGSAKHWEKGERHVKGDSWVFDLSDWMNSRTICCSRRARGGADGVCGRVVGWKGVCFDHV